MASNTSEPLTTENGLSNHTKASNDAFEKEIKAHFEALRAKLQIEATTTTPKGQTVDWIKLESQGAIASQPSNLPKKVDPSITAAVAELELEGATRGPEGTVPILRKKLDEMKFTQSLQQYLSKAKGARGKKVQVDSGAVNPPKAQAGAGVHRYGSSGQAVTNYGGSGGISVWQPTLQTTGDFSLLQIGVVNNQQNNEQTVEAGWQVYQAINGDLQTHLFTYFTVNGYSVQGNDLGGYDTQVSGWVQVSTTIFPGTVLTPISTIGGTQVAVGIQYQLFQGNWWLGVNGSWIGYYPGSMYATNGSVNSTLGYVADNIGFWGEVYDDQTEAGGRTTTDMGSGQFPSTGFQHSAFMNVLTYQSDTAGTQVNYDGTAQLIEEDPDMYQIAPYFNSGTTWGSYVYVGGPGAG